jgi:hypothetical protein
MTAEAQEEIEYVNGYSGVTFKIWRDKKAQARAIHAKM